MLRERLLAFGVFGEQLIFAHGATPTSARMDHKNLLKPISKPKEDMVEVDAFDWIGSSPGKWHTQATLGYGV